MTIVELECPNCGAKLDISNYAGRIYDCKYCNTKFVQEDLLNKKYRNVTDYDIELENILSAQKYKSTNDFHRDTYGFIKKYPKSVDGLYYYLTATVNLMNETGSFKEKTYIDNMNRFFENYKALETNEERLNEIANSIQHMNELFDANSNSLENKFKEYSERPVGITIPDKYKNSKTDPFVIVTIVFVVGVALIFLFAIMVSK